MAKLIYELEGVRGRTLKIYDTKCVITTKKTVGSFITSNFTDGEKTIFLIDVVGVQFKKSGALIGYLQFETASIQMNNNDSNFFSENTFTFEEKNGITNALMEEVYTYVVDRIEELKYGARNTNAFQDNQYHKDVEEKKKYIAEEIEKREPVEQQVSTERKTTSNNLKDTDKQQSVLPTYDEYQMKSFDRDMSKDDYMEAVCEHCNRKIMVPLGVKKYKCPFCDHRMKF